MAESTYQFPYPYLLTDTTFSVFLQRGTFSIDRSNTNWDRIVDAVNGNRPVASEDELVSLISAANALEEGLKAVYGDTEGNITIKNGSLFWNGKLIDNAVSAKFLDLYREGFPTESFVRFAEKLYANPWIGAREELYPWLEQCELPIFPDGDILAYKRVNPDYTDCHTGTIDNHIGAVVTMDRDEVDQDRRTLCSTGLHFCSKHYLSGFHPGSPVMLIKINPADVVSVPYNEQGKGRCSRYEVVGEIPQDEVYTKVWPAQVDHDPFIVIRTGWVLTDDDLDSIDPDDWDEFDEDEFDEDEFDEDEELQEQELQWLLDQASDGEETAGWEQPRPEDDPVVINSPRLGVITKERVLDWVNRYGTYAAVARGLGVSAGTVHVWKSKLGL